MVTHVGSKPVRSVAELANELDRVGIGNASELTIIRRGEPMTINVTVIDIF